VKKNDDSNIGGKVKLPLHIFISLNAVNPEPDISIFSRRAQKGGPGVAEKGAREW